MIEIVDQIKAFEDLLRQGQPLSAKEAKELAKLNRVTKEMKRINVNKSRKKARDSVRGAPGEAYRTREPFWAGFGRRCR